MTGTAWISWQRLVGQQLSLWYAYPGAETLVLAATSSSQRQVAPAIDSTR